MFTECETLVTETKLEAEIECSFPRVTVTVAIDEQLNELAAIRVARAKTAIWQNLFILWLKNQENRLCQRIPRSSLSFVMSQSVHQSLNACESIHKRIFLWDFFERSSTQQYFLTSHVLCLLWRLRYSVKKISRLNRSLVRRNWDQEWENEEGNPRKT